jgi:ankyrin repeat protein
MLKSIIFYTLIIALTPSQVLATAPELVTGPPQLRIRIPETSIFDLIDAVRGGIPAEVDRVVAKLPEQGLSVDSPCAYGETALTAAATEGMFDMLSYLHLFHGASADACCSDGKSPLVCVIQVYRDDCHQKVASFLIEKSKDLTLQRCHSFDRTPIFYSIEKEGSWITRALIKKDRRLTSLPDRDGVTPLIYAAALGHLQDVMLLIASGAFRKAVTTNGHNAYDYALSEYHKEKDLEKKEVFTQIMELVKP